MWNIANDKQASLISQWQERKKEREEEYTQRHNNRMNEPCLDPNWNSSTVTFKQLVKSEYRLVIR